MLFVRELYIYPVKSLGGIAVDSAELTDRGFQYDRRWMLVNAQQVFMTQREYPQMALLQTEVTNGGIRVYRKDNPGESVTIPFHSESRQKITVTVWEDSCEAVYVSDALDQWFSHVLGTECRLLHMPDDSIRKVDERYALRPEDITSFSDGYPLLILGEESLQDLNSRLEDPLPMNRFRPNIVMAGGEPYEEDQLQHIRINGVDLYGVKLCARCVIPTINQDSAVKNKEPLKTLYTYRKIDNNVYFGQNLLFHGSGSIQVGGEIHVIKKGEVKVANS